MRAPMVHTQNAFPLISPDLLLKGRSLILSDTLP